MVDFLVVFGADVAPLIGEEEDVAADAVLGLAVVVLMTMVFLVFRIMPP